MATKLKIKVLRPFFLAGKPVKENAVLEVEQPLAVELITSKKAELVVDEAEAPAKGGKGGKGKKGDDAGGDDAGGDAE